MTASYPAQLTCSSDTHSAVETSSVCGPQSQVGFFGVQSALSDPLSQL